MLWSSNGAFPLISKCMQLHHCLIKLCINIFKRLATQTWCSEYMLQVEDDILISWLQFWSTSWDIREGVKKNRIYLGLCPKLWVGGSRSRSKVPNFLVKISIQLFLLQTSRNVLKHVIHKWGGHIWPFHDALRPQRFWNFGILSEKFLIFSKK